LRDGLFKIDRMGRKGISHYHHAMAKSDTTTAWSNFEREVAGEVLRLISSGKLALRPSSSKVHHGKGYFSKDRGKEIIFDVAIEVFASGATVPSLIWLWECKDYATRNVEVGEIEEFWTKIGQVGAHKGTLVTRIGIDQGAVEFAKSKGIGLARLEKVLVAHTNFAADAADYETVEIRATGGVSSTGRAYTPDAFWATFESAVEQELRNFGLLC
jgi:hypothetical protein